MRRLIATTIATTIATAAIVAFAAAPAQAAKGGGGKPAPEGASTVSVRNLDTADTVVNWGDTVTFDVATTATDTPAVRLDCYQGGTLVYTSSAGFYPWWPWETDFQLKGALWTSGEADCSARLYRTSSSGLRTYTLATQSFHVAA